MRTALRSVSAGTTAPYQLLTLSKPGFDEDVAAAFVTDPRFGVRSMGRGLVKAVYPAFLPAALDDNGYLLAPPEVRAAKIDLRAFWFAAWPVLQRAARADAVLTGNFGYHAEQELAAAVEAHGVPFIAMHKEALKTPGLVSFFAELYRARRQPFAGRRVLTYNQIERSIQIDSGMASADRITVCGMPRLDRSHRWRLAAAAGQVAAGDGRPRILFFAFHPKTGLPFIPRKATVSGDKRLEELSPAIDKLAWSSLCSQCFGAMYDIARRNPSIELVIKGKGDLPKWTRATSGPELKGQLPANVRIQIGGDPQGLIAASTVITGFNTTALLEGVASGKSVVVPRFAEAAEAAYAPYFLDLGDSVDSAASVGDYIRLLVSRALSPPPPHAELASPTLAMLDLWAGNTDGLAASRVAAAVAAEIDAARASGGAH
jgi:hypothetical protein